MMLVRVVIITYYVGRLQMYRTSIRTLLFFITLYIDAPKRVSAMLHYIKTYTFKFIQYAVDPESIFLRLFPFNCHMTVIKDFYQAHLAHSTSAAAIFNNDNYADKAQILWNRIQSKGSTI